MRVFGFSLILGFLLVLPGFAAAEVSATPTLCADSPAFVPYIYEDGLLHSFDVILTPADTTTSVSRVTVGGNVLDTRYATIWAVGDSTKVHVDVPNWLPLNGNTPISVSVSRETCQIEVTSSVYIQRVAVSGETKPQTPTTGGSAPQTPAPETKPETQTPPPTNQGAGAGEITMSLTCSPEGAEMSWSAFGDSESYIVERSHENAPFSAIAVLDQDVLKYSDTTLLEKSGGYEYRVRAFGKETFLSTSEAHPCTVEGSVGGTQPIKPGKGGQCGPVSFWGWIILAVALMASSAATVYAQGPLLRGNGWRFTLALFVPFALLLGMWFFLDLCRTNQWFPIAVTLITLITLFIPSLWPQKVQVVE